jgi:hypothetical protein
MKPMQQSTQGDAAVVPVQAPAPPATIRMVAPDGKTVTLPVPRTESELRQLLAQREELSNQLSSVSARRSELASEIRNRSVEATRGGLEERLRLLDNRIFQLESDLASTGRQIASAPPDLIAVTHPPRPQGGGDDFEEGFMAGGFFVLLTVSVVLFFLRRRWKRRRPALPAGAELGGESAQRLERLETGMEAIAIEIERVSEGQRFVTRLLSESQPPLGKSLRVAQPSPVGQEDPSKR